MPGLEHFVIAILVFWNIVCASQSASVEHRHFLTRLDVEDPEDFSNEDASLAKSMERKPAAIVKYRFMPETEDSSIFPNNPSSSRKQQFKSSETTESDPYEHKTRKNPINLSKRYGGEIEDDDEYDDNASQNSQDYQNANTVGNEDKMLDWVYRVSSNKLKEYDVDHKNNRTSHTRHTLLPENFFLPRMTKRTRGCLKKCLTQRLLHPAMCHSLC